MVEPMKQWVLDQIKHSDVVETIINHGKTIQASSDIEKALALASAFRAHPHPMLVICHNAYAAQRLFDRLASFLPLGMCDLFTVEESLRIDALSSSPEASAYRVDILNKCIQDSNRIIVTHGFAAIRRLPSVQDFKANQLTIKVDMVLPMDQLVQSLIDIGYEPVAHVVAPLTFARRGSVVDIYPIDHDPFRIEYFDDTIESIRNLDVTTQLSSGSIETIHFGVASEYYFSPRQIREINERLTSIKDGLTNDTLIASIDHDLSLLNDHQFSAHLYPLVAYSDGFDHIWDYMDHPQIIADPWDRLLESTKYYTMEATTYLQELVENHHLYPRFSIFHSISDLQQVINGYFSPYGDITTNIHEIDLASKNLDDNLLIISKDHTYKTKVLAVMDNDLAMVVQHCVNLNIPYVLGNEEDDQPPQEGINIIFDTYYEGFAIDSLSLVVYTPNELIHRKNALNRFANKYKNAEVLANFTDLKPRDYVVHNQYGIGQYLGLTTKVVQGLKKDFLHILYADNGELFVPLEQFHLVRKFVGSEGVAPRLNKLGSDKWQKTKAKLHEDLGNLAARLVELYSDRKQAIGFAYPQDDEDQISFEQEFEYPLTADQQIAVREIKDDMEKPYPMDRLLCGDVGFGKTEVAIRCAYKAVKAGKQVAVLCPTTLLSRQHYITFTDRFKDHPVNVALLNRFVPKSIQDEVIRGLASGKVDIVVGTHRLLNKSIAFKDLGFLIVDEEHRFGVEQKERIAEMKHNIDVLSLSATPIPRTMQMSLMGVRPCSQLRTPPSNRFPVATYVIEKNDAVIREVIERELARNGQVFYLFNDTVDIYPYAKQLQRLLPNATIGIAHGQMNSEQIEDVMDAFISKKIDILLCTTIIENGIDIPNANTILVDNAQRLGLAQLYQIKGRVGRSNRVGYAYLMVPPKKQLSEVAQKRLNAIKEFAHLGDGYQIAMRDLMIRGAGDLLGAKQSGFIDTVGIDMVIDVLKQEIAIRQDGDGQTKNTVEQPVVKKQMIPLNATIPDGFTSNSYDKIDIVTTLEQCKNREELLTYQKELKDQYGKFPKEVEELFLKRRFELAASYSGVERTSLDRNGLTITLTQALTPLIDGELLFDTVYRLDHDATIAFRFSKVTINFKQNKFNNLRHAIQLLENIEALLKTKLSKR